MSIDDHEIETVGSKVSGQSCAGRRWDFQDSNLSYPI